MMSRNMVKSKASSVQPSQAANQASHWSLVGSFHHGTGESEAPPAFVMAFLENRGIVTVRLFQRKAPADGTLVARDIRARTSARSSLLAYATRLHCFFARRNKTPLACGRVARHVRRWRYRGQTTANATILKRRI